MSSFGNRVEAVNRRLIGFGLVAAVVVASIFVVGCLYRPAPAASPQLVRSAEPTASAPDSDPSGESRDQYIERRHGGGGVDWRRMDRETRDRIRSRRQALIRKMKTHGRPDRSRAPVGVFALEPADLRGAPFTESFPAEPDGLCGVWVERGSTNQAGRTLTADLADDGTIYAASDGGVIWSGTLAGGDWQSLNDHHAFDRVTMVEAVAAPGRERLLVLDKHALHRSDDNGLTWRSFEWRYETVNGVVKDDDRRIVVAVTEWNHQVNDSELALYGSDDLGESFQRLAAILTRRFSTIVAAAAPDGTSSVYVLVDEVMHRLSAAGELEPLGALPLPDGAFHIIHSHSPALTAGAATPGGPTLYVALPLAVPNQIGGWDVGTHFFVSVDGGFQWEHRSSHPAMAFRRNSFACSKTDPAHVYFGTACDLMFRSEDAAGTWAGPDYRWYEYYDDPLNKLHCDIPGIKAFPDPLGGNEILLIHTDGGTYVSDDDGRTVTNLSLVNLRCSQYYSVYTHRDDPSILYAGSQDQGFQRTDSIQNHDIWTFDQLVIGDDANIVSGDGGETIWWVYPGSVRYLANAPTSSLTRQFGYGGILGSSMWLPPLMADPDDPNRVYLGGGNPHDGGAAFPLSQVFWFHYDQGAFSWGVEPFEFAATITALAYSPIDTDVRYVLTEGAGFYFSSDRGEIWTRNPTSLGSAQFGAAIAVDPLRFGRLYIGGSGYQGPPVRVSDDHGATFEDFGIGLPGTLVNDLALSADGRLLFAATEVGPFAVSREGGVWQYMGGVTAPDQAYTSVEVLDDFGAVRFATYGRGVWDFQIRACPTRVRAAGGRVEP